MFRTVPLSIIGKFLLYTQQWYMSYSLCWLFASRSRMLRWLSHRSCRQPKTYVKREAAITVFELLMMSGVSPETGWAIRKHWYNKFYYTVASCWLFLCILYYDARIHEHQIYPIICNTIFPTNTWCELWKALASTSPVQFVKSLC
jgi:hypothetical protein